MNKSIIFYNIDNNKMITLSVENREDTFKILEEEKLVELGLSSIPNICELEPLIDMNTFTLIFSDNFSPYGMNYNEWETLRSKQANIMIQARINSLPLQNIEKEKLKKLFDQFTEGMRIKYLGQKSWNSLYEELLNNLV